jgi:hypothetical protein
MPSPPPHTTLARGAYALVVTALAVAGCRPDDPFVGQTHYADGLATGDGAIDAADPPDAATPDALLPEGCQHDVQCAAFGRVCDVAAGRCVQCLTDQHCPASQFCLDQACWDDVCAPGETRCYGKPQVAMCAANGGAWLPSDCPAGQLCLDGKCRPPLCKPGTLRCQGAWVMRCAADGSGELADEDCAATDRVCQGGLCKPKGCEPGAIACADHDTALVCNDADVGFEPLECGDDDACTFDLCKADVGCSNPPKPNGVACGSDRWCTEGVCTAATNNLIVIFDTSGSMSFKVPGRTCYDQSWPVCLPPHLACDRMGVSKSVFASAFKTLDPSETRVAMFRFPQLWLPPEATTTPKPPHWKPPVACSNGYYVGYNTMTGHTVEEAIGPGTSWYWDHLDEVLCLPFPATPSYDPSLEIGRWMDGVEVWGEEPELRAIGSTPIARTLFYVGEYLRNRVVVDGKACGTDADCGNANYVCKGGACTDPARACRQTSVVVFTDGGEINDFSKFFAPWVQAKRLAYGLGCQSDADCVGGARCLCPVGQTSCAPEARACLPESFDTGHYCRTTMQTCLPSATPGDPGYCAKKNGQDQCIPDPVALVAATATTPSANVLRSPDGQPFGARVHVIDISADPIGIALSGNLARAGNGLLLAPEGQNIDAFLAAVIKAFDVAPKPACGANVLPCAGVGPGGGCDDANPCTTDACNPTTGTCSHTANTAPCDDGNACTLSDRCLDGDCRPGIAWVETLAGSGFSQPGLGPALQAGLPQPRGVVERPGGGVVLSDGNRLVELVGAELVAFAGGGEGGKADGPAESARFLLPAGLGVDGATVLVADRGNHRVRAVANTSGGRWVSTLAGSTEGFADGPAALARFDHPGDVTAEAPGVVLVADRDNHRLRRIAGGEVATVAGDGKAGSVDGPLSVARLNQPASLAVGAPGVVYLVEAARVRRLSAGFVVTVAGGAPGFADGVGDKARFEDLRAVAVRGDGGLVVTDAGNHALRLVSSGGAVTTLAGGTSARAAGSGSRTARTTGCGWSSSRWSTAPTAAPATPAPATRRAGSAPPSPGPTARPAISGRAPWARAARRCSASAARPRTATTARPARPTAASPTPACVSTSA